ncbi:MAG: glycerol-3-phosphate acyltransferase [Candidatus Heimdallarchaeota archaeon]|nr:glycerol-3-phosphate acyltransferase [Candidatus Heimdallarchaeota archaeon]
MALINILWISLACIGAYIIGSIPFSVWIGKLATGKDLRNYNIGNPGGFNAMITYGPFVGLSITFLDIFKGALTIALIDHIFSMGYFSTSTNLWHVIACILGPVFCILGHNYSFWLKFKGGRGTGVLMGTLLYVNPLVYFTYMIITAIQIQGLKIPSRLSNVIVGFFFVPIAFFIPISPPWTFILESWTVGSPSFAFLTQGLLSLAMWLAIIPKHWSGVVKAITGKGEDWNFSTNEGQKIDSDFQTKKEAVNTKTTE